MTWYDDLTEEQRRVASHIGSHARLLAGPGTGKTRSLIKRVVFLMQEKGVSPADILMLAFTRAATAELRKRLRQELGPGASLPRIATLHSFALTTILKHHMRMSLPQPIRIADDYEERWIIQEDLKDLLKLQRVRDVWNLLNQLSADWEQLRPDWEARFPNPQFLGAWREHRKVYSYLLRAELVYQLRQELVEGALVLDDAPAHLLVDEYQDLNACDLAVIKALCKSGIELFCAGDDDQSIYGFRYANPEGIRRFPQEYNPCCSLELVECKRCDRAILDLGLYVARQDPRRIDKSIQSADDARTGLVRIVHFANQYKEAEAVARLCRHLVRTCGLGPENILILYRSDHNGQISKPIRQALLDCGLEAAIVSDPMRPLNCPKDETNRRQTEGREFLSMLRLLTNPDDHLAWRTLLELRKNRVGAATIASIYDRAQKKGVAFASVLRDIAATPQMCGNGGENIRAAVQDIESILDAARPLMTDDLQAFIHAFAESQIAGSEVRTEVCSILDRVLVTSAISDLEELLRAIHTSLGSKEQERQKGAVNLMTMHQAKGLTADAVFIVGAEEEFLPGRATGEEANDERRLLYVSITRAKHFLVVTHCLRRVGPQQHMGSARGKARRKLTSFLSGGPVQSMDGDRFLIEVGA